MKKKTLSRTLSIIILLGITFAAAAAVVPVLSASSAAFKRMRGDFLAFVRDKTGLTLSYKALSPSVLSGIRMSDITVNDIETAAPVLQIRSVKLRWNIFKVITGHISDAFGEAENDFHLSSAPERDFRNSRRAAASSSSR